MYNRSCHWTKHFLRLCLPVLLQQNLRCKVWDDTAKIRYIALFAISEQCRFVLKLTAFNSAHSINTDNYSEVLPLLAFHMLKYDIKELKAETDFFFFFSPLPSPKRVNHISDHNSLDWTMALYGSGIQKRK